MKKTEEKKTIKTAANAVQFEKPYSKTGKTENKTTETETPKKEFPEIVETQKNELPKAEYETPKTEAIEELQKRLAAEIERIEGKRKIAEKRGVFIETLADLKTFAEKIVEEQGFETQSGKLVFQIFGNESGYSSRQNFNDMFSISNTALILKFAEMLTREVCGKIAELETQLLQP